MRDLKVVRQPLFGDGEAVILACDFNATAGVMAHRVVRFR